MRLADSPMGTVKPREQAPVVFIAGPTASGKTALAMALADRYPTRLINVDAVQVYRGMDIGSAKPDTEELARYPHRLIDIRDPSDSYDAAQFRHDALLEIEQAHQQGALPVLVGGTMFYFAALEYGISTLPHADNQIRAALAERGAREGWAALHDELAVVDAALARRIKPQDQQRIARALEIHELTGASPSEVMQRCQPVPMPYRPLKFALYWPDRRALHARIEARFQHMLESGLVAEVEMLLADPCLDAESPALRAVGYRQVVHALAAGMSTNELLDSGVAATRQFAKRQLTWLRHQAGWVWLDARETAHDLMILSSFFSELEWFLSSNKRI